MNISNAYLYLFYFSFLQVTFSFPINFISKSCNNRLKSAFSVPLQKQSVKGILQPQQASRHHHNPSFLILFSIQNDVLEHDSLSIPKIKIEILYESKNVIAINKPPHIQHHNDDDDGGIMTIIREMQKLDSDDECSFPYKGRIYGVHRLDRVTSGILIFAKNEDSAKLLTQAFRDKAALKYYVALSGKKPRKKKQGWVKGDMSKGRRGSWRLDKTQKDPAITRFYTAGLGNVLEQINQCPSNHNNLGEHENKTVPKTVIIFQPHTGRTHQLRVAAKSIGIPILGDPNYSDGESTSKYATSRTFLHAIAFHLQLNKEQISIICAPKFGREIWNVTETSILDDFIMNALKKHCDSEPILHLLQQQQQ